MFLFDNSSRDCVYTDWVCSDFKSHSWTVHIYDWVCSYLITYPGHPGTVFIMIGYVPISGYNYIFTIPVESTDILITQYGWKNGEDNNFLGW